MRRTLRLAPLCLAGLLALSACGGSDATASTATTQAPAASTGAAAGGATTDTDTAAATTTKVSANDASVEELTTAFQAAGIPSAARWAHEVEEYRPYPADDADLAKLRGELAKYNPSPDVLNRILATLEP